MNFYLRLLLLITNIFYLYKTELYNINDFKRSYFKIITANKGFYEVETGLDNLKDEIIVYNGFVNDDLYTDLVTVNKQRSLANFYVYDNDSGHFLNVATSPELGQGEQILQVKFMSIREVGRWPNVVIVSYIKDGGIKTIFRGYDFDKDMQNKGFYKLNEIKEFKFENDDEASSEVQEPYSFQVFSNDKIFNYFLMMKGDKRMLYYFDLMDFKIVTEEFKSILTTDCKGCLDIAELDGRIIPPVYTAAFKDINRDCHSDLVLETQQGDHRYLEFFIYTKGKFGYIKSVTISKNYSIGSLEDVNENNTPDLVFFDKVEKKLNIFLNDFSVEVPEAESSFCL